MLWKVVTIELKLNVYGLLFSTELDMGTFAGKSIKASLGIIYN